MRHISKAAILIIILAAVSGFVSSFVGLAGQTTESPRAPFSLVFPDLDGRSITEPEVMIPTHDLHTLRLHVGQPVAGQTNYGGIYTKVNGEAAGVIQSVAPDQNGLVVKLDLDNRPRFKLRPGKNVIEILATDRSNRSSYASYVLRSPEMPPAATIEHVSGSSGADRQPPIVDVTEPAGNVWLTGTSQTVLVQGTVTDDSGVVASVTVNYQPAAVSSAADIRNLIPVPVPGITPSNTAAGAVGFERRVNVSATTPEIVIEAKDGGGNLTRVRIPVTSPEPALATQFKGRKFALVAGVSRYKYHEDGLTDLKFADADAHAFQEFLQQPQGGGFAASDIRYLANEKATVEALRTGLKHFLAQADKDDLVVIFLSGHGGPDRLAPQNLYYLVSGSRMNDLPNTALPMTELQDVLEHSIRARRVLVFIDTCHSAGIAGNRITTARGLENNLINLYASRLYSEAGRAVLTSSDINESSLESESWGGGHGVFTWAVLEGLRGQADSSRDRLITVGELFGYVRDRVRKDTNNKQNPRAMPGLNANLTVAVVPQ